MESPVDLQKNIEEARLIIHRRRAYVETIQNAFPIEGLEVVGDNSSTEKFANLATDSQRADFFEVAPAELAAAFVLMVPQADRARLIVKLIAFDPKLFSKLLEGL